MFILRQHEDHWDNCSQSPWLSHRYLNPANTARGNKTGNGRDIPRAVIRPTDDAEGKAALQI